MQIKRTPLHILRRQLVSSIKTCTYFNLKEKKKSLDVLQKVILICKLDLQIKAVFGMQYVLQLPI